MGLLGGLLFLPVTAPVRGFRFLLESLRDEADAVLHDEGRAFAELIDLSMRRSAGQLSEAEFAEQEAVLLERLGAMREHREALLHGGVDAEDDDASAWDAWEGEELLGDVEAEDEWPCDDSDATEEKR